MTGLKASFVVDPHLLNDEIFRLDSPYNRDNCLYGFTALRNALRTQGIELRTFDLHPPESSDIIILNERPSRQLESRLRSAGLLKKSVLLLFESELIRPDNWEEEFHKEVAGVLTWSTAHIRAGQAGARYARFGFTHKFPSVVPGSRRALEASRAGFCTLIAGNKSVSHRDELYSARREVIEWFEKNHSGEFEYYGVGWEHWYLKGGFGTKVLRKMGLLTYLPKKPSICYGGMISSKLETLSKFEFSICYENAKKIPGYISEKIFDSMFAGCIPVYLGAPDISDFIPKSAFIDANEFASYDDLYRYMKALTASDLVAKRTAIDDFLKSEAAAIFDADRAALPVARTIAQWVPTGSKAREMTP